MNKLNVQRRSSGFILRFSDLAHEPGTENDSGANLNPEASAAEADFTPVFQRVSITGDEDTGGVSPGLFLLAECRL